MASQGRGCLHMCQKPLFPDHSFCSHQLILSSQSLAVFPKLIFFFIIHYVVFLLYVFSPVKFLFFLVFLIANSWEYYEWVFIMLHSNLESLEYLWPIIFFVLFCFVFFGSIEIWNQSLTLAKPVLLLLEPLFQSWSFINYSQ
jgi:hypothetical protein